MKLPCGSSWQKLCLIAHCAIGLFSKIWPLPSKNCTVNTCLRRQTCSETFDSSSALRNCWWVVAFQALRPLVSHRKISQGYFLHFVRIASFLLSNKVLCFKHLKSLKGPLLWPTWLATLHIAILALPIFMVRLIWVWLSVQACKGSFLESYQYI